LMQLEFKEVELLEHLVRVYKLDEYREEQSASFKIDYKYLIKVSSYSSVEILRLSLANLERLNFLAREVRAANKGGILQLAYARLNQEKLKELQQLLPKKQLTI